MTESDGGVDLKKIDYLGRGVDGRTPPETWLDELDAYSSEKIRDLHPEGENFKADYQVHRRISESRSQLGLSVMRAKGKLGVNLHPALQLGAKLSAKRDTSKKLEKHKYHNITRRMTMIDDTSKDPGTITRNGKHYTKYECQLSQFILEHIEFLQRKANKESAADKYLGREITDLKGEDAVVKLEEYFGDVRERKKSESTQHLWQMVADACCSFMDEKKYTHYVYHIVLGASSQDSFDERESSIELSGGINAKGTDSVDVGMKGGFQKARKGNSVTKDTRGEVDSDGVVTNEEVIGVKLKPVSVLINRKSWELKVLIEGLLCCYDQKEKGEIMYEWGRKLGNIVFCIMRHAITNLYN